MNPRSKTKRRSPKRSLRRRRYRAGSPLLKTTSFSPIFIAKFETQRESNEDVQKRKRMQESIETGVKEREERRLLSEHIHSEPVTGWDKRFETPFIHGADGRHILPLSRNVQLLGYRNGKDGIELYSVEIVLESEGGPFMFLPLTKWDPNEWSSINTETPLAKQQILDPKNSAGVRLFDVEERLVPDWGSVSSFVEKVRHPTSSTFTYMVSPTVTYTVSPMVLTNFLNDDDNDDRIFHMALLHREISTGGVSVISFSAEKGFGYELSLAEQTMSHVPEMGPMGTGRILAADPKTQSSSSPRTSRLLPKTFARRKSSVDGNSPSGPASARV